MEVWEDQVTVDRSGQRFGPYSLAEVKAYLSAGQLFATDQGWIQSLDQWMLLSDLVRKMELLRKYGGEPAFNCITDNPYRVLGLPIDASDRQIMKAVKTARIVVSAGHNASFEADVNLNVAPDRGEESIVSAGAKIEQQADRLHYALFWFWNRTDSDRYVLESMGSGAAAEGIKVWEQILSSPHSAEFLSAKKNISLYYLDYGLLGQSVNPEYISAGLKHFGEFLKHPNLHEFETFVFGTVNPHPSEDVAINAMKELMRPVQGLVDLGYLNLSVAVEGMNAFPEKAVLHGKKQILRESLANLEKQLKIIVEQNENSPESGLALVERLLQVTTTDLGFLRQVLDKNDYQLKSVQSDLAESARKCILDYWVFQIENKRLPDKKLLGLLDKAAEISQTGAASNRIKTDREFYVAELQEMGLLEKPKKEWSLFG